MIFLIVLSALLYFTKKKVWADVHAHPEKLQGSPTRRHDATAVTKGPRGPFAFLDENVACAHDDVAASPRSPSVPAFLQDDFVRQGEQLPANDARATQPCHLQDRRCAMSLGQRGSGPPS